LPLYALFGFRRQADEGGGSYAKEGASRRHLFSLELS
jgi:hypothetical protein